MLESTGLQVRRWAATCTTTEPGPRPAPIRRPSPATLDLLPGRRCARRLPHMNGPHHTPPSYRLGAALHSEGPGLGCHQPSISEHQPHFGSAKSKSRLHEGAMTFAFPFENFLFYFV